MRKSEYKYKVYNGKVIKDIIKDSRIIILILLIAVGIIIGATVIKNNNEIVDKVKYIISSYAMSRAGRGSAENFLNSLLVNLLFTGLSVFLSFSLIGYPFIMLLPFLRGVAIGTVTGYLYAEYGFMGLGYSLLMIYPSAILTMTALTVIFNESCIYSHNAYLKAIAGKGQYEKNETRIFLAKQLIFTGIAAIGSAIDALSVALFSGFFHL
ncbi:MAG: stage II sporulation protein M [Clostridia bacterium]|nr:stage II sporulation protein M [Clostridia bacterium]